LIAPGCELRRRRLTVRAQAAPAARTMAGLPATRLAAVRARWPAARAPPVSCQQWLCRLGAFRFNCAW